VSAKPRPPPQRQHAAAAAPCTIPPPQGKGEGFIRLGLQYRRLDSFTPSDVFSARKGLLLVAVIGAKNLVSPKGMRVGGGAGVAMGGEGAPSCERAARSGPCRRAAGGAGRHQQQTTRARPPAAALATSAHALPPPPFTPSPPPHPQVSSYVKVKVGKHDVHTPPLTPHPLPLSPLPSPPRCLPM
jgi:hypothetical protein